MLRYAVTELGTLGGPVSCARSINAAGVVVGKAQIRDGAWRAAMWAGSEVVDLGRLPGTTESEACGINAKRQVVGVCFGGVRGAYRPFLWQDGEMVDLGDLGGSASASDINGLGQVAGGSFIGPSRSTAEHHAVLWVDNGAIVDLGTLPGSRESHAWAINDAGLVAGVAQTADGTDRAVLWQEGEIRDLGTLGGADSGARAVNGCGQVVGAARTGDGALQAFLWADGTMVDLGTLDDSRHSRALGINDRSHVVGVAAGPAATRDRHRAVLWRDRAISDLNALIDDATGWQLSEARDINDRGQIVGKGALGDTELGFLLTPDA
jgi:probable HAF family extracellular repeat protein